MDESRNGAFCFDCVRDKLMISCVVEEPDGVPFARRAVPPLPFDFICRRKRHP